MSRDGSGEDWANSVCEQVCMVLVVGSSVLRWPSILVLVVGNCRHMHGWGCGQVYSKRATVWSWFWATDLWVMYVGVCATLWATVLCRFWLWAIVGYVCKCICYIAGKFVM